MFLAKNCWLVKFAKYHQGKCCLAEKPRQSLVWENSFNAFRHIYKTQVYLREALEFYGHEDDNPTSSDASSQFESEEDDDQDD